MSDGEFYTDFPPWDQMDFSRNCTAYGNWLASFLMPNPWQKDQKLGGSYPLSIHFVLESIPPGFEFNATGQDLIVRISQWFTYNLYNRYNKTDQLFYLSDEFFNRAIWAPTETCRAEYCKAMAYTGNADLTGIGVYVSYFVEAGLATLYLFAFTYWQIQQHYKAKKKRNQGRGPGTSPNNAVGPSKPKKLTIGQRIVDSFRGSIDAFLTATMLISVVMLIAAIKTSLDGQRDALQYNENQMLPVLSSAVYDMVLSLLAAVFSIFPVMLLYALIGRHSPPTLKKGLKKHAGAPDRHRVWLRRTMLVIIWALGAAEVYLSPRGDIHYEQRHDENAYWNQDFCDKRGGTKYWAGMKAAQFLIIGVPLFWLLLTTFVLTGFWIPGLAEKKWVTKWRSVWRLGIAWINLGLMWGLLAYFSILREKIILTAGGLDETDDKWTFGQILALGTWVPVVAEFLYIFIWGIEESLGTHLPAGFKILRHDSDLSNFSAATMGFDPFDDKTDEEPLIGPRITFGPEPVRVEMVPVPQSTAYQGAAYQGGYAHTDVRATEGTGLGLVQQPQQQPVGYDSGNFGYDGATGTPWQQQNPWDQWNRTGW